MGTSRAWMPWYAWTSLHSDVTTRAGVRRADARGPWGLANPKRRVAHLNSGVVAMPRAAGPPLPEEDYMTARRSLYRIRLGIPGIRP